MNISQIPTPATNTSATDTSAVRGMQPLRASLLPATFESTLFNSSPQPDQPDRMPFFNNIRDLLPYNHWLVVGLGKTAQSVRRYVQRAHPDVTLWGYDDQPTVREAAKREGWKVLEGLDSGNVDDPLHSLGSWSKTVIARDVPLVIVSPGIAAWRQRWHPVLRWAREHQWPLLNDIDLWFLAQQNDASSARSPSARSPSAKSPQHVPRMAPQIIGITGTNGKSTVTAATAHILRGLGHQAMAVGNIGLPVLDALHDFQSSPHSQNAPIWVVEFSSFQLELLRHTTLKVACILNLTPDHVDRYDSHIDYAAAKLRILSLVEPGGTMVARYADPALVAMIKQTHHDLGQRDRCDSVPFAANHAAVNVEHAQQVESGIGLLRWVSDMPPSHIHGGIWDVRLLSHNVWFALNVVAAFLGRPPLCVADDVADDLVQHATTFQTLDHRCQTVAIVSGATPDRPAIVCVNDSKATNPDSAAAALQSYPRLLWLVGGRSKKTDLDVLDSGLTHVERAYVFGEAAAEFSAYLTSRRCPHLVVSTMEQALRLAFNDACTMLQNAASQPVTEQPNPSDPPTDPPITILLSPACSSFDAFANFVARGNVFSQLARELTASYSASAYSPSALPFPSLLKGL